MFFHAFDQLIMQILGRDNEIPKATVIFAFS